MNNYTAEKIKKKEDIRLRNFLKYLNKNSDSVFLDFGRASVDKDMPYTVGSILQIPFRKNINVQSNVSFNIYSDLAFSNGDFKPTTSIALSLGVKKHKDDCQKIAQYLFGTNKENVRIVESSSLIEWDCTDYNYYNEAFEEGQLLIEKLNLELFITLPFLEDCLLDQKGYKKILESIKDIEDLFMRHRSKISRYILKRKPNALPGKGRLGFEERKEIESYALKAASRFVWELFNDKDEFNYKKYVHDYSYGKEGEYPGYDLELDVLISDSLLKLEVKGSTLPFSKTSIELTANESKCRKKMKKDETYFLVVVSNINITKRSHKIYYGQWVGSRFIFKDINGNKCNVSYRVRKSDSFRLISD